MTILKTKVFVCHNLKCASQITNDTSSKKIEWLWGIEKTGVDESKLVFKTYTKEITFGTDEEKIASSYHLKISAI